MIHWVQDQNNNPVPFDQVFEVNFEPIFNYILRRVGNVADAQDLTSRTFFLALRSIQRLGHRGVRISAWLYRIATNEVNGYFRKKQRGDARPLDDRLPLRDDRTEADRELRAAEAAMSQNKAFRALNACMQQLPALDQTLIALRYFEEKPYADMAKILGKRRGSLITRTNRALKKLKNLMEQRGISHERFRESLAESAQTKLPHGSIQAGVAP